MMITFFRVDDRLIHGQVAYSWTKHLEAEVILVANDKVVNDPIQKMSLNLAKPSGVAIEVASVADAVKYIQSTENQNKRIFVLVNNSTDALTFAKSNVGLQSINLGGMRAGEGKQSVSRAIYVNDQDIQHFKEIEELGIEVEIRQVPTDSKKIFSKVVNS
ncbi:PTS system mannose/fructose/N-acetylgalactosamine-transporter subunit IIB [Shouchella clausii]|uniref:PTS system mannose/fructose/N-acetylgalactosamine-transporter subunit IIB n=1 Tax=Shouchella clausii TaxID=79880 RepID=UPI000BA7468D|nr:PTS sugar transporter subunit IIB [Shouchella clausii]PAD93598.1 hypothetical protein CHH52_03970 [Shouchella clausii]